MVHDLRSHCPSWPGRHDQRCLCGGRSLWQLLAHILVHWRAEMGQEVGWDYTTQGSLPSNPLSLLRIHPKGCIMSPHSATSWGPTVQTLELVGDISHPNHSMYLLASLLAPCFAIMSGIHCRVVGICCSSSA